MLARRLSPAVLALVCAAPILAADDKFNMDVTVEGVQLGEHIMGAKLNADDLKGRVVMVEFWGIRCGPCLASLPHVAKINDELSGFGLVVIGAHAQQGTTDQIRNTARSRGVNFTVVENARVSGGNDFSGIPHCMIFDHKGKCVYRGHPTNAEKPLREALGKSLAASFEGTPVKPLQKILDTLRSGQSPSAAMRNVVAISRSSDKEMAAQAKKLLDNMSAAAIKQVDTAQSQRSTDAITHLPRLMRISADFKGTPIGSKAAELLASMKKDKVVIAEMKARPVLDALRFLDSELQKIAGDGDVKAPAFQKAQASVLKKIGAEIKKMNKNWPEAPATTEALEIAERYGIDIK